MGVGFFENQPSGCLWYRIKHPKDALTDAGVTTKFLHLNEDIELDDFQSFLLYGVYPFSFADAIDYLKSEGKKVIYDCDDAVDLVDPTNPFYFHVKKDAISAREIFKKVDMVTVSTPNMAAYVKERCNLPVTILPNCYNQKEWTFPRPKREGIRIGFAGSATHVRDLMLVLPAIKKLQQEYDITFLVFGFSKVSFDQWLKDFRYISPDEAVTDSIEFEHLMRDIKFEWVPNVDFNLYPQVLTNMSLDIGICPLIDTPFNRCRSASKAMEYTLSGALAIASNVTPYTDEPTSILTDNWYTTLKHYIDNPKEREEKREQHLEWLRENRDITKHIDLLKEIYLS